MKEELNNKQNKYPETQIAKMDSKKDLPLNTDGQIIIEEKQSKPNGEINIVQFVRGPFLGKGGFAKCYEFTRVKDKQIFAGKLIAKNTLTKSRARQKLLSEIKIHRSLVHRHIVGFEHFFEDYENVYILLELCRNQSMNELLRRRKRLHELEVQCYTVQIVSALKYMHAHKVIHRDLKLGNLFLNDKMEVKIGDFGLASKLEFDGDRKRTICGTPNYIAPEILDGKTGHSYEVDVWSLGVIIYTFLIGKPPFETSDVKTTYSRIKKNQYTFPESVKVSKQAKSLIDKILQLDPADRLTLDQILEHDFFRIGQAIPKNLPGSTLACPPSDKYIKQYWPMLGRQGSTNDLVKTMGENGIGIGKENQKRIGRETALLTDRESNNHRGNTISPSGLNIQSNPENNKRFVLSKEKLNEDQWDDSEEPYIKKWIDYSNKYGIGYILSTNACGVYFNDNSKIILASDFLTLSYIEKGLDKQESTEYYSMKNYPPEIKKKVTLLIHFKNYMDGNQNKTEIPQPLLGTQIISGNNKRNSLQPIFGQGLTFPVIQDKSQQILNGLVFVKKYMKTKHAILFRLSNKVVQVNFEDQSEIMMSSVSKKVSYLNKKGERFHYQLSNALESGNAEMIKRLNYARQVLEHSLKQQNNNDIKKQQEQQYLQMQQQLQSQPLTQRASSNNGGRDLIQIDMKKTNEVSSKKDNLNFMMTQQIKEKQSSQTPDHQNTQAQQKFLGRLSRKNNGTSGGNTQIGATPDDDVSPPQFYNKQEKYEIIERGKPSSRPLGTAR